MEETIVKYHEEHEVVYTLMATVDGEVVAKFTDDQSADGVSGYASLLDEAMRRHIIDDVNSKAEYAAEASAEDAMEMERGN